ncbi:MAG: HD domain-containing protein [Deltaproteobacteria bacterium]
MFGVVLDLAQAIQAASIYPEQHPQVQAILSRLYGRIGQATGALGTLHLGIIGDHFVVDEFPFLEKNPSLAKLLSDLREKGMEKISFADGLTEGELKRFVYFLATGKEDASGRKWERISHGTIQTIGSPEPLPDGSVEEISRSHLLFGAADVLRTVLSAIAGGSGGGKPLSEGRDIVRSVMKGLREDAFLIHRLLKLTRHDDYTLTHCLNVCAIVVAQAATLGFPEERIQEIGLAALLHDIGKEKVPAEILQKPGKIDPQEFARMAEHPALGANILRRIDCGSDLPVIVCYEHHLRYDGTGYPKASYGPEQHPVSRMTQIADVYDALRTHRPYRKGMEIEAALSIMERGKGTEFDPVLYDNFLRTLLKGEDQADAGT